MSDNSQINPQLLQALGKIDRPGSFCISGRLPSTLPGLEVDCVGPVALPLGERQAASLKSQARQAPFGKGEKTLVNTDVRRVWEIDANQVRLANPKWADVLKKALAAVRTGLGLENQKLEAHFYKLLLYEPGSFFLSHRDGERIDRMVATLVISLASAHEGGELIVRHEGQEESIRFGGPDSRFETQFAAFYADCEHEVLPVLNGVRLTLVYNLTLAKSKRAITAPASREHVTALSAILARWRGGGKASGIPEDGKGRLATKLAILLDHKYTQAGLTFDALKGVDARRAALLCEAARQSRFDAYLCLVTCWQSGWAEATCERPRYRYGYPDEGLEDDDYEMGELMDWSLAAEHFSDFNGHRLQLGEIQLDEGEVVSKEGITHGEPDEEDVDGYTGNEGVTLERWYRRAAVILWPSENRFEVLCQAGVAAAVGGLEKMVRQWEETAPGDREVLGKHCLEFASSIIEHWPVREYAGSYSPDQDAEPDRLLPLLGSLGDRSLIAAWLRGPLMGDVRLRPGKSLGDICRAQGWATFAQELRQLFAATCNETILRNARLLADLSLRRDPSADRRQLCNALAAEAQSAIERWDRQKTSSNVQRTKVARLDLLPPLVLSFVTLNRSDLLVRLVDHILSLPKKYPFTRTQIPALLQLQVSLKKTLKEASPPIRKWLTAIREKLKKRVAAPPQEPADWRRDSKMSCQCEDCTKVSQFLGNAQRKTLRLPLAKERRRHLHQVIDRDLLDLSHVTERRGRPYTLVCTKNKASYERALRAHRVDLDHLEKIQALSKWHENLS